MQQLSNSLNELIKNFPGKMEPIPTSQEERVRRKCDWYNNDTGDLNKIDGYNCEACNNKGYIAAPRRDFYGELVEMLIPCKCQQVRKVLKKLKNSGLDGVISKYTFDNFRALEPWQETIKNAAQSFTEKENMSWFFVGGQSGCGKSFICTAICGRFLKQNKDVYYMLWRDDMAKLKAIMADGDKYLEALNKIKTVNVLYIDDLFKNGQDRDGTIQNPTAADINIAFEIINYRSLNPNLITIISSERQINKLLEIDEALAGRIAENASNRGFFFNIAPDVSKNQRLKGLINL